MDRQDGPCRAARISEVSGGAVGWAGGSGVSAVHNSLRPFCRARRLVQTRHGTKHLYGIGWVEGTVTGKKLFMPEHV